jgi:hypothetical protein
MCTFRTFFNHSTMLYKCGICQGIAIVPLSHRACEGCGGYLCESCFSSTCTNNVHILCSHCTINPCAHRYCFLCQGICSYKDCNQPVECSECYLCSDACASMCPDHMNPFLCLGCHMVMGLCEEEQLVLLAENKITACPKCSSIVMCAECSSSDKNIICNNCENK